MSMYQTHILKNGLKVIHQQVDGKAAWCGLIIGVGSRDERPEEEGIAHFIEHVIFKGTEKRKAFHILSRIEDVGGELNAYIIEFYPEKVEKKKEKGKEKK